jgi:hypothetical protein
MANRAFLQMDQAEPEDQNLLWDKQECRPNSSLDCSHRSAALGLLQIQGKTGTDSYSDPQAAATQPIQSKKSLGIVQCFAKHTKWAEWRTVMYTLQLHSTQRYIKTKNPSDYSDHKNIKIPSYYHTYSFHYR